MCEQRTAPSGRSSAQWFPGHGGVGVALHPQDHSPRGVAGCSVWGPVLHICFFFGLLFECYEPRVIRMVFAFFKEDMSENNSSSKSSGPAPDLLSQQLGRRCPRVFVLPSRWCECRLMLESFRAFQENEGHMCSCRLFKKVCILSQV